MAPFDTATYDEAAEHVEENDTDWLDSNRRFAGTGSYEDPDHWQDGEGVLGDLAPKTGSAATAYNEGLKKVFVVEDLISDVVRKRTTGVLGSPPSFALERESDSEEEPSGAEPSSAETSARDNISAQDEARQEALRRWWEDADALETMKAFASALTVEGKAYLRPYVSLSALAERAQQKAGREGADPEGEAPSDEQAPRLPDVSSPEEALEYIHLEAVGRDQAALYVDPATKEKLGVLQFEDEGEDGEAGRGKYVELTYLDDEGRTVYRVAYERDSEEDFEWRANLRGHLMLYEGESPLLITDSVRRNQKDLNTKRTQISISDNKTAFRSWQAIDVMQPTDEEGNELEPEMGPGSWGFYMSVPTVTRDEEGNTVERRPSPQIQESDPVDNSNLRDNCDAAREAIYRSTNQLHRAISGDAMASGESRIQARGEFVDDLKELKTVIDGAGVWLAEIVWALAEVLAGREPTEGLKGVFDAVVNPGPLSAEERQAIESAVEKRIISRKRARELWGIDDTAAEREQIQKELEEEMAPRERVEVERTRQAIENDRARRDAAIERRRARLEAAADGADPDGD